MTWTDERVETLKARFADGLSAAQIAAELGGLTRNAVTGKLDRLGLSRSQGPRVRKVRVRQPYRPKPKPKPIVGTDPIIELETFADGKTDLPPDYGDNPVSLLDLTNDTCRWPIGDPSSAEFVFCGGLAELTEPYCWRHRRVAYQTRPRGGAMQLSRLVR